MLLCKCGGEFLHYFGILVSTWLDDTKEKLWWNTESKHTVHIRSHDFQMEESLEKLLEVEVANVHGLDIKVFQVYCELRLQLLVFHVLHVIILELLR